MYNSTMHVLLCRWYQAKDLMMMSHLQEGIQHADVPTQVCLCMYRLVIACETL